MWWLLFMGRKENKGATMIEYALIAGLIAIVAIGSMRSLGLIVTNKMSKITTSLDGELDEEGDGY